MDEKRFEITKKAGILGIIGNIFLLIIKAIVGFIFKSQAMIADSFNSAGDIFASLMTFIGNRIASVPHDEDHNFGHGKAEYIFSMKKYHNILLESNMKDHRNDCIVTTFTLISTLLTLVNIYWFDSVVGIGISIWIAYTGISIFLESYNVLMDISVDEKTTALIFDIAHSYKDIKKIDNISSTPVGSQYIIFITICVDGNMSTFNSHSLANSLEEDVSKLDNVYNTIVHVEPI